MPELLELTIQATYSNQECINRWNYLADGTPSAVTFTFALISAFGLIPSAGSWDNSKTFCKLLDAQVPAVAYQQAIAINVYDPTDFYDLPFPTQPVGGHSGTGDSPVNAYGYRSNQTRRDIRRGYKRLVGVSLDLVTGGGGLNSGAIASLTVAAAAMTDILTYDDEGNTLTFTPCIVGKEKYTTPSGKTAYRYYASKATQLTKLATSIVWEPYHQVRSQTSRQYGKGI